MKNIWKWILGVIVLLFIGVLCGGWYLSRNWKPLAEEKLAAFVKEASKGLYTVRYDALDINPTIGNISFKNLKLKADTAVYGLLEGQQKASNNMFDIEMKSLYIKRFSLWDLIRNRKLSISSIELEDVVLHLTNKYHQYNDTIPNTAKKDFGESLKKVLSQVSVNRMAVDKISVRYTTLSEQGKKISEIKHHDIAIQVGDFLLDSVSALDTTRLFYTRKIVVAIPAFSHRFSNNPYKGSFEKLVLNTEEKSVVLTKGRYEPTVTPAAYYRMKGENKALTYLRVDSLRLDDFDFHRLLDERALVSKKVLLRKGYAKFYGDKRFPKKPENQIGQAPHQKIMRLPVKLILDTVVVQHMDVVYTEMGDRYQREGTIDFISSSGHLTNVTNDTLTLQKHPYMRADLKTKVMNSGALHVIFSFDMLSRAGAYSYKGEVGRMQAPPFNRILHPLLNFDIATGNIKRISFNMQGTDRKTTGTFYFDYDHMKVRLPDIPRKNGKKTSGKIVSWVVNQLLINDSNPDANEVYHVGKVDYVRVADHTFFKNIWKSLLEGIKQTAGISKEREDKLLGQAESTVKAVAETKKIMEGTKKVLGETKKVGQKTGTFFKGLFKKKPKEAEEE
ncbi:hypothetical protein E2P86_00340 [Sphingobacterium psychroaquaticum]|uniref:hypothetical protein n=1 Tax=Sphingobacterium psychroaquaticum TaxID=561061 RepID=UPI00106D1C48|nr:hypothetical protein [Sphingobacterium psychroaquaticum]QBQ39687.1 hypothetical protein E2P86_00340 [Sphingobacterium psychroaquaticum]